MSRKPKNFSKKRLSSSDQVKISSNAYYQPIFLTLQQKEEEKKQTSSGIKNLRKNKNHLINSASILSASNHITSRNYP